VSLDVGPRSSRRMIVLSIAVCIVLIPLTQAALGYLSGLGQVPWYWLAGTPLCYLLICGLGAFCAVGGLAPLQARGRGSLIGIIAGAGGAVLSALIVAVLITRFLNDFKAHPPTGSRLPGPGLALVILFFWFVPLFLGLNLLGIALAALGGMLGGYLRGHFRPEGESAQEWSVEEVRVRPRRGGVVAAVIIAVLLAMLMVLAFFVFITGAFP
jgi:hypothetical protein